MGTVYSKLSRIPIIRHNYSLKFLFVAFIGIHIPLIGIVAFALSSASSLFSGASIMTVVLIFTLLAAAITLFVLNKLLAPLFMSDRALKDYVENGLIPNLPTHYEDEAGKLMSLIQETIKHLDKLAREKQEVTSLISHNLRTPLSQIVGLCNLVKLDAENTDEYLDKIETVTKLQLRNLSDLLTQMTITGNKVRNHVGIDYRLNSFINEELLVLTDGIDAKNLKISLHLSNENLTTNKSRASVSLVLQNLLSNAVKFSYANGEIRIYTRKANGKLEIEVVDEGLGFPADYHKNLFNDARSTGRNGTSNEPSIGLGLYLSKKIIEQIDGKLEACSEGEGKGASFKIIL